MSFKGSTTYSLTDLYSISSGLSKSRKDFGFGYPFISFKDVFYNFFLPTDIENFANTTEKERHRCSIEKGDVFLTRTSETQEELGMSSVALKDYPEATFNGFTKRLRLKEEYKGQVDQVFVAYYLRSKIIRDQINSLSIMTTRASLNNSMIEKLTMELPSIKEQAAIGSVLKRIDEKIETNNQINKTLENMAQAIFANWFIDFEFPNEDGKPYQSSGGEMVESELGMIPKGWEVVSASDICNINIGKTPPRKQKEWFSTDEKDIRWISIKDLGNAGMFISKTSEYITEEGVTKFNVKRVPDNTVVLSFKLTVGRVAITIGEMLTNEAIAHFNINNNDRLSTEYIYLYLKMFNYDSLGSTSSIAIAVNSKIIKAMPILVPSPDVIKKLSKSINAVFEEIKVKIQENDKLINLRDTLLPKLMSGEIRVPIEE